MESAIDIATPVFEEQTLDTFGSEYPAKALVLQQVVAIEKIVNEGQFQQVATAGLEAAANIKALEAYVNPIKERAYARWKRITTVLSEKTAPFLEVKTKSSRLIGAYQHAVEQQRMAEEAAQRARLMEEEARLRAQQAEQLAAEGRIEDGVALLESPVMTTAPVAATTQAPKAQGVTNAAEKWSAEVVDLMTLVKAVAEGKVPLFALQADMTFLNSQARSMKQLLAYPGVEARREFKSSFRPK